MRHALVVMVALSLVALARPLSTQLADDATRAERFIQYITVADPYGKWQMWPGTGRFEKGRASHGHGPLVTAYLNRAALQSVAAQKGMAAESIIVLENWTEDRKLAGLTTMYRVEGYNREGGDWYWVETGADLRAVRFGKVQACIECHALQARNDYLWTAEVVKGRYNNAAAP